MDAIDGPNGVTMDSLPSRSKSDHTLLSRVADMDGKYTSDGMAGTSQVLNGHRLPSYVGISCAISGYCDYNRYSSSVRNSCTRRDIRVTLDKSSSKEPVNGLNDSLNRKNSLISEALITSRHNVNEDIDDIESTGTDRSADLTRRNISAEVNDKNSMLEQRIASLYGQTFAKDWRESRSKTKYNTNFIISAKHRSPSCPPIRKTTLNKTPTPLPTPPSIPMPPNTSLLKHLGNNTSDHPIIINTQSKPINLLTNCEINQEESVKQLDLQNDHTNEDKPRNTAINNEELSSDSLSPNESQSIQNKQSSERDGNWFLSELNKTTLEMQRNIDLTDDMLNKEDGLMSEDISGKLRAAVGKANLLINKKFKQFEELCLKNISQSNSEQFMTTNDDLQGFWDMMSIQVIDINDTFTQIHSFHASGWNKDFDIDIIPKKMTSTPIKTVRSRKSTPKGSPVKACDESTADRESERRNRLKEAKRKARLKASQTDDEITIFIPSKAPNN